MHQNLSEACKTARVALEDAIAELDNVAEDSHKDSTMFRQCGVSDLCLVQMIAPKVEHGSVLRVCVKCASLTFYQHCSCTPAYVVRSPADAVTSSLAQVFSQRVIHGVESQHSTLIPLDFLSEEIYTYIRIYFIYYNDKNNYICKYLNNLGFFLASTMLKA